LTTRLPLVFICLCLALSSLTGCAQTAQPPKVEKPATPAPAKVARDYPIFSSTSDVVTLDPQNMTDNTSEQVTRMMFNNLIKFDDKLVPVPDLAESWTVSSDQKTWTFKIRKGVKFHDGTPLNASAVKKSFDRVLDAKNKLARRQLFDMIKEIKVLDESTLQITTFDPFGAFPATLAHGAGAIINADVAAKLGEQFASNPNGTGPYKFTSWKKDQELILDRFDDYWGPKGVSKRIVYKPIVEAASRVMALETGEVDAISHIPDADLMRLEKNPNLVVNKIVSNSQRQFRFHMKKKPYDNPKVRQAISYAIDRQAIVDNLFKLTAVVSTGALAPVTWGYANLGVIPYDPAKAKKLLAEAGYPNGFKATISTTERYTQGREVAEVLAAQLKKVGIECKIDVLEWATIRAQWSGLKPEDCKLEIFIMGAGPSTGDADWGLRPIFQTPSTGTNENNYGFYSNKEFDKVILQAMQTTDQAKRKELYKRAQQIVYLEDPGAVWLYDNYWIVAHKKTLKDVTMSGLGLVTFEKAYLDTK